MEAIFKLQNINKTKKYNSRANYKQLMTCGVKSSEKDRKGDKVHKEGSGAGVGLRTFLTSLVGRWMISFRLNFLMVYPLGAPPPGLPQRPSIVS